MLVLSPKEQENKRQGRNRENIHEIWIRFKGRPCVGRTFTPPSPYVHRIASWGPCAARVWGRLLKGVV